MSGKCQKIHIQILYIHCHMGNALGSVRYKISTGLMGDLCKMFDVIFAAQYIGYLGHGHNLRPITQSRAECFFGIFSILGTLQILYHSSCSSSCLLPGQEIAVVLHDAHQDFIPRLQHQGTQTVGHQIQAFRGMADENDLRRLSCI